jgi:mRNA interferase RelE/StbE
MYQIIVKKSAAKELSRLVSKEVKKISAAIDALADTPRPAGCKKLEGQSETLWRIRVGDYRNHLFHRRFY